LNFYQTMKDNAYIVKLHVLHQQLAVLVNQVRNVNILIHLLITTFNFY
jgi:hypothetical protein